MKGVFDTPFIFEDENILMHTFVAEEIKLYKIDSTTFIIQCID